MHKNLFTAVLALGLLVAHAALLRAQEDSCGAGSDDQWSSFAHDNGQTSASTLSVGDPNGVTLVWTRSLPRISNFTNPTVKGNIIYHSTDSELNAYNLATGAPAGTFAAPEIDASNRGNTTVAHVTALGRDVVFATGGNFNSITALETNLESSPKIWSNNVSTFNTPNGLRSQSRFNTCRLVDVSGTQVLFVSTDPAAGTGLIYAFIAATGALYPGWGTNPVVLDAAAKHGPAVSSDGSKLYVGTAIGGSNIDGSLYQIDAATGAIDWTFVGTNSATEGWPSGVSTEGDFLYGATRDAANAGVRYKIDKSGAVPVVVWSGVQGVGLYGTPTIGRGFVYFPLDIPSFGLLQVDKASGLVARNFGTENICGIAPGSIPLIVTLSCDAYLFAGDRGGRWWLMNANSGNLEWYRQFPITDGAEFVSGTALATYTVNGDDYAVVAVRELFGTVGHISAFKLNSGPRPRLIQCVYTDTVLVPLGTGPGNPRHIDNVFMNIGNAPLNFSALTITDPLPNGLSSAMGNEAFVSGRVAARSMAASAATIRTSAVLVGGTAVSTAIAPGGTASLDWVYDGTGLGGGRDANDLEFTMDDPDFNYNGSLAATLHILYLGPCACDCHTDPVCDGTISNVQDVVATIGVAFRSAAAIADPNAGCPHGSTDMDCTGVTDAVDVVRVINVAFRGANPAIEYCVACP